MFNILFFVTPLIFYKNTSELFEFNKIIILYGFTALIVSAWAIQSIRIKKFIFKKTILDLPLIIYLSIYLISSLLSIDTRTSFLGYYGRFNGGLISQICYALLYWAFVSNMTEKQAKQSLVVSLWSIAIASILGTLEHFGIFATCGMMGLGWSESCWLQDVQSRVFSTLGQPNWLAATITALMPITWYFAIFNKVNSNFKFQISNLIWFLTSTLFFVTLLFTKSRSGLLAFGVEAIIFWGFIFLIEKNKYLKEFIFIFLSFSLLTFVFLFRPTINNQQPTTVAAPVLESGGTESGTIRKFVWLGALLVFKHYPILGTGPETFAFSFPMYKPVGHNLTSEWDFLYNKAHNEFLNYLANTGLLGFLSYTVLIIYSLLILFKNKRFDLLAGYIAILVTNFFGFSVVPISLLFFLFPAIASVQSTEYLVPNTKSKMDVNQIVGITFVLCTMYYVLFCVAKYWQADIFYNKAKTLERENKNSEAIQELNKSISFSKNEAIYISEIALNDESDETALKALDLNKYNQNIRRIVVNNLVNNSDTNQYNLLFAEEIIKEGIKLAPNDPKQYYQLGILELKMGKNEEAVKNLEKSVSLKPNYKEGRFILGATYKALKENTKAVEQFEYVLKNIDPKDELTKKYLDEVN